MGVLDKIGIIGIGGPGKSVGDAILRTIVRITADIGCRELYLNTRTTSRLNDIMENAYMEIANKKEEWQKIDFTMQAYPAPNVEEIIEKCSLVILSCHQDFGYGLKAGIGRDYLKQEEEKRARGESKTSNDEFERARTLYLHLHKEYGSSDNFRIFYSLPYNWFIIKELAEKFKKNNYQGIVLIFTNPIDIMTFNFAVHSGVVNAVGCNEYEPYRGRGLFQEIADYLLDDWNIVLDGNINVVGEHGPDIIPLLHNVRPQTEADIGMLYDAMDSIKEFVRKKLEIREDDPILDNILSTTEIINSSKSLQKAFKSFIKLHVEKLVRTNPEGVLAETPPVLEYILKSVKKGKCGSGLNLCKATNLVNLPVDDDDVKRFWDNYRLADRGAPMGWTCKWYEDRGTFIDIKHSLTLEDIEDIVNCYRKHHKILDVISKIPGMGFSRESSFIDAYLKKRHTLLHTEEKIATVSDITARIKECIRKNWHNKPLPPSPTHTKISKSSLIKYAIRRKDKEQERDRT